MMTYEMNLNRQPFDMIKSGRKTIELRLNDEKRKNIVAGDKIMFTSPCGDTMLCIVEHVHNFPAFKELYESLPLDKCGYLPEEIPTASYKDMEEYYPIEKQKKHSVLGIEIALIS